MCEHINALPVYKRQQQKDIAEECEETLFYSVKLNIMKPVLLIFLLALYFNDSFTQTCNQPGALLTVRTAHAGEAEYIVFTFVDPHKPKGELTQNVKGPFIQTRLNNPVDVKGEHFHQIVFTNTPLHCDTRDYIFRNKKIADVKRLSNTNGTITYVIGLVKDAKITAHLAYNYHGFHIVKLKVK